MTMILFLSVLVIVGIYLLGKGADWLVQGASAMALRFGVTPLVVGLTVVAMGTSAPELITSLLGKPTIAVLNASGSNLMNLGLILGITALLAPMNCQGKFLRFEVPVMFLTGPALLWVAVDLGVSFLEGAILTVALAAYLVLSVQRGKVVEKEVLGMEEEVKEMAEATGGSMGRMVWLLAIGLLGLVAGARMLLDGAIGLAELFGVPERVIGITLIAGGTSLPELATCVVAARKNQQDIALGNLVGSNIFNVFGIVGVCGVLRPLEVPDGTLLVDIPAVIVIQALAALMMFTNRQLNRSEGVFLLVFYFVYIAYLFIRP